MATQPRDFVPGIHHIWVNATGNEAYYVDDIDRMAWIRELIRTSSEFGWTCLAFSQMTTHVHALLDVPDRSLPAGMQRLNFDYSRRFNARHDRVGQFVRRRYGNRRIGSDADLIGAFAYCVLNPVKAGLCSRAEDWRWSSFATTLGIAQDYPFVDATRVLGTVGGSTVRLLRIVEAQYEIYVARMAMSRRLTTGRVA